MIPQINSQRWLSLQDLEGEQWKSMEKRGYEIMVSNYGRVKAMDRLAVYKQGGSIAHRFHKEEILKCHDNGRGYLNVTFCGKKYYIHRLVASAFIPNDNHLPEVDHFNGNKYDNRAVNLRWVSKSQNLQNPITEVRRMIVSMEQQVPFVQLTTSGEFVREWPGLTAAAKDLGCSISSINVALRGGAKTSQGFVFIYKRDYDPKKDYSVTYKRNTQNNDSIISETGFVLLNGLEIVRYFPTSKKAAIYFGMSVYRFKGTYQRMVAGLPIGERKPHLRAIYNVKQFRDLSDDQKLFVRENISELVS